MSSFIHSLFMLMGVKLSLNCSHLWAFSHPPYDIWIWSHGGMIVTWEKRRTQTKTCPNATLSTHIPHGLIDVWTQTSTVRERWLTAWAMAWPLHVLTRVQTTTWQDPHKACLFIQIILFSCLITNIQREWNDLILNNLDHLIHTTLCELAGKNFIHFFLQKIASLAIQIYCTNHVKYSAFPVAPLILYCMLHMLLILEDDGAKAFPSVFSVHKWDVCNTWFIFS
jgi:hypothetical protein